MHEIFIPFFFPVSLSCADSGCDHIWIFVYLQAVLIPDVVDVEAPEYLATGLVVLLYLERDPRCLRCFRGALPVHVRYHRPAGDGEEALVALKSPEVLVCCCDGEMLFVYPFWGERSCEQYRIWIYTCLLEVEFPPPGVEESHEHEGRIAALIKATLSSS